MGLYDRDYFNDKLRHLERGEAGSVPQAQRPVRSASERSQPQRPLKSGSDGPPDLSVLLSKRWVQVLLWLAIGAVVYGAAARLMHR